MNLEGYRPTARFSAKARYYDCRPDYPARIIEVLRRDVGLSPGWVVADLGAGTGKLSAPFLDNGNRVFALEPNAAMLAILRRKLGRRSNGTIRQMPAEATGLEPESIDLIAVGQAYHWFEPKKVRIEFDRILASPGYLLLASNRPAFTDEKLASRIKAIVEKYYYKNEERIVQRRSDYPAIFAKPPAVDIVIATSIFENPDHAFNAIRSNSFCPDEDDPGFADMRREFRDALNEAAVEGKVASLVETRLTCGRLK